MDSQTGAAVQGLPIDLEELDDGNVIHLPCPDSELVRLMTVVTGDRPVKRLQRRLRLNPSLLLFALGIFRQTHRRPPCSADELLAWSVPDLFLEMGRTEFVALNRQQPPINVGKSFRIRLENFLQARTNKELRNTLAHLIQSFCGTSKSTSRAIGLHLVGTDLNARDFKCKRLRRQQTAAKAIRSWRSSAAPGLKIGQLVNLAGLKLELESCFDSRLRDRKMAAMKQLAYGASHEINNPLANIATRAQTMLARESDHEKRHKLTVIYEQAMRAHEMISDMMLFAHPPAVERERVSIRLMTARIVGEMKPDFEQRPNVELTVVMGAGVDQGYLDRTQFGVALKCLIRNSLEALDAGDASKPQIQIRVAPTDAGDLQFSIWDNGPPVSNDVVQHMFDPFYSGREAGRGLGFGLSKVWTIAKLHGGHVRYDDEVEYGTRFVVTLPAFQRGKTLDASATLTLGAHPSGFEDAA